MNKKLFLDSLLIFTLVALIASFATGVIYNEAIESGYKSSIWGGPKGYLRIAFMLLAGIFFTIFYYNILSMIKKKNKETNFMLSVLSPIASIYYYLKIYRKGLK